ncbi:MAG: SRPBCC family protein [Patescibacteria group bacterium]
MINIEATINAPVEKVWTNYTEPEHITKWNFASDDWMCPSATNDLRVGGMLTARMEAKDGSFGFDFGGTYTEVIPNQRLAYTLGDGRKVEVNFSETDGVTTVTTAFDAETQNPEEMQRQGWQAILNNFKKHVESN